MILAAIAAMTFTAQAETNYENDIYRTSGNQL